MFETAVLTYGPASKRVWTTFMGMTGQVLLVGTAIVVPLLFPTALPKAEFFGIGLVAPTPPPRPPAPTPTMTQKAALRPFQVQRGVLYEPGKMPDHVTKIVEEIEAPPDGPFVMGAIGDNGGPAGNSLVQTIIDRAAKAMYIPPAIPRAAPAPTAPAAPAAIERVRLGGMVKEAIIVRRVEPIYPEIARRNRVAGKVRLEGVIGIDGRIRELRTLEGNPLLIGAALDAVRQWLYKPTTLNGEPVEVVAPIEVIFRLN